MTLNPRESGELIASFSGHVTIREEAIKKLGNEIVKEIRTGRLSAAHFPQNELHPKPEDPTCLDWFLVLNTISGSIWSTRGHWMIEGRKGYSAMCVAINRAVKEHVDILNPKFYSTITEEQLRNILRSDTTTQISRITERVQCLHEVGKCLLKKYDGSFRNVVDEAENSAVALLNLIVSNFECFRDEADYKGRKVAFYKKAQTLVSNIWACFRTSGKDCFKDIEELTMLADYRVPQSLVYYGVLEYSRELSERVRKRKLFENGEEMEVEIRGCSVEAVERLKRYISDQLDGQAEVNSIMIDHYLWQSRKENAKKIGRKRIGFHRVRCIYY